MRKHEEIRGKYEEICGGPVELCINETRLVQVIERGVGLLVIRAKDTVAVFSRLLLPHTISIFFFYKTSKRTFLWRGMPIGISFVFSMLL